MKEAVSLILEAKQASKEVAEVITAHKRFPPNRPLPFLPNLEIPETQSWV